MNIAHGLAKARPKSTRNPLAPSEVLIWRRIYRSKAADDLIGTLFRLCVVVPPNVMVGGGVRPSMATKPSRLLVGSPDRSSRHVKHEERMTIPIVY